MPISDRLIFSSQVLWHDKCSLEVACLENPLFFSVERIQLRFTTHFSKVSSSLAFIIAARIAKRCIKLDRIFQPIPPLIPRSIEASFFGPKHAYSVSTQSNLLRVVNSQIISISRLSFARRPTCSRCCRCTAASRRAETL